LAQDSLFWFRAENEAGWPPSYRLFYKPLWTPLTIVISTINHRIQPLFLGNWTLSTGGPILFYFMVKPLSPRCWCLNHHFVSLWLRWLDLGLGSLTVFLKRLEKWKTWPVREHGEVLWMISQHQVDLPVVSSINIDRASSVEDVLMIGSYFVSFFIMFLMSLG
jgi:hypothetical protein